MSVARSRKKKVVVSKSSLKSSSSSKRGKIEPSTPSRKQSSKSQAKKNLSEIEHDIYTDENEFMHNVYGPKTTLYLATPSMSAKKQFANKTASGMKKREVLFADSMTASGSPVKRRSPSKIATPIKSVRIISPRGSGSRVRTPGRSNADEFHGQDRVFANENGSPRKRITDPNEMLQVQPRRNMTVALANSARKHKEDERVLMTPSRGSIGQPRRVLANVNSARKMSNRQDREEITGAVSIHKLGSPPQLGRPHLASQAVQGLRSPPRRVPIVTGHAMRISSARKFEDATKIIIRPPALSFDPPPRMAALTAEPNNDNGPKLRGEAPKDETAEVVGDLVAESEDLDKILLEKSFGRLNMSAEVEESSTKDRRERLRARAKVSTPVKARFNRATSEKKQSNQSSITAVRSQQLKTWMATRKGELDKEPLSAVTVFVDVRTSEGDDASASYAVMLKRLGARIVKQMDRQATHVVFKQGSPRTLEALSRASMDRQIYCVSISWVIECHRQQKRVDETLFTMGTDVGGELEKEKCGELFSVPGLELPRRRREQEDEGTMQSPHMPRVSSPLARKCWTFDDSAI
ncbi:uncharacterized protein V1516DRAFT_687599 [Lipomyces oligophaga]|uniref:uncharacterized protein n=1 Tax=Lipomyces oligophaga TaxID=45792 RepID=UPI0034CF3F9D